MTGKELVPVTPLQPQQLVLNVFATQADAPGKKRKAAKDAKPVVAKPRMRVTEAMVARSRERPGVSYDHRPAFMPAQPTRGVFPAKAKAMAMDDALACLPVNGVLGPQITGFPGLAFSQGYTFLGYPYLSELAQIPEYRMISEVIATEATRKWIKIKSQSDEDDKEDKIKELEKEFERLGVRDCFRNVAEQDGFFGRSHIFIDTGEDTLPKELTKPIGAGDEFTRKKFGKKGGWLRTLKTVEPVWAYPANYNSNNPLKDDWYRPDQWYVFQQQVHRSRFLTFVSREVPDLQKPAFSFGGLSLSQMAKPYVDNWLETRQSVNDIIQAFSVMVLKTDMAANLQGSCDPVYARADLFNNLRNNRGVMMLDKNLEDFANVSAPLGTLDKLQAQAQEHMASVSRIPLVKLLGISPSGLNATSDGEIRVFYDTIHAYQESFFTPHLRTIFHMAQLNIWGEIDPDLVFEFNPLWEMDEKAIVDMQKAKAETHQMYVEMGAIDGGEEVRKALVDDPNSPYQNIDPEDVPELEEPLPVNVKESDRDDEAGSGEGAASENKAPAGGKKKAASGSAKKA